MRKILLTLMIAAIPVFAYADVIFVPEPARSKWPWIVAALVVIAAVFVYVRKKKR